MRTPQGLEIRVGLLIILGVVATVVMIMLSDKLSFERYYHISIYLDDAGGLRSGSPVTLSGIAIGNVTTIDISDDPSGQIRADARIRDTVRIPANAILNMSSSGIFGDSFLAFTSPSHGPRSFLALDGSAHVKAMPSFMGIATDEAKGILQNLSGVIDKDTAGNTKLLLAKAASLAEHIESQDRRIDALLDNLQIISENLKATTTNINHHSEAIANHLDSTLGTIDQRVQSMTTRADVVIDKLGNVATQANDLLDQHRQDLATLVVNLRTLSSHAANISAAIDSGQGVLGRLVFSHDLAQDVDNIAADLSVAAKMIDEHPSTLVWGQSSKEANEAKSLHQHLLLERNFHQDFGDHAAVSPAPPASGH
jgi:phospholipid/cholesterol/gamma-HCH transport system substrate-binding protein